MDYNWLNLTKPEDIFWIFLRKPEGNTIEKKNPLPLYPILVVNDCLLPLPHFLALDYKSLNQCTFSYNRHTHSVYLSNLQFFLQLVLQYGDRVLGWLAWQIFSFPPQANFISFKSNEHLMTLLIWNFAVCAVLVSVNGCIINIQ